MGLGLYGFSGVCLALFILIQLLIVLRAPVPLALLWAGYGVFGSANILVFALLAGEFPRELGRVAATTNLLTFVSIFVCQVTFGWIVELWPRGDAVYEPGSYPAGGYLAAWGGLPGAADSGGPVLLLAASPRRLGQAGRLSRLRPRPAPDAGLRGRRRRPVPGGSSRRRAASA
ncbi:membrane transport protein [Bordetella pertussis]|nr:membrane transport protein [Bordetella pertussis]